MTDRRRGPKGPEHERSDTHAGKYWLTEKGEAALAKGPDPKPTVSAPRRFARTVRGLAVTILTLGLVAVVSLLGTGPAQAVRVGSGAPGHVGVVNHAKFTIKVSGHKVKPGHTRFNVDSDTITIRANHKWKVAALGGGGNWSKCQPANATKRIGITKKNTGAAHQLVVARC